MHGLNAAAQRTEHTDHLCSGLWHLLLQLLLQVPKPALGVALQLAVGCLLLFAMI